MIRINEPFFTKDAAIAFARKTLNQFNPDKFGTRVHVRRSRDYQFWEVVGSRFDAASPAHA